MMNLKPCAHCGSSDVRLSRTITDNAVYWYVECVGCGIRTMSFPEDCNITDSYASVSKATEEAIECATNTWNARV